MPGLSCKNFGVRKACLVFVLNCAEYVDLLLSLSLPSPSFASFLTNSLANRQTVMPSLLSTTASLLSGSVRHIRWLRRVSPFYLLLLRSCLGLGSTRQMAPPCVALRHSRDRLARHARWLCRHYVSCSSRSMVGHHVTAAPRSVYDLRHRISPLHRILPASPCPTCFTLHYQSYVSYHFH